VEKGFFDELTGNFLENISSHLPSETCADYLRAKAAHNTFGDGDTGPIPAICIRWCAYFVCKQDPFKKSCMKASAGLGKEGR
jgi:hypothetical protein